jgi:hypothetical protein
MRPPVAVLVAASAAAMFWTAPLAAQEHHGSRMARPVAVADRAPVADTAVAAVGARGVLNRQREFGLTPDQSRLLDAVARRYDDQDKLLRDDKARAASRAAERREVSALLNPDQRAKAQKQ